MTFFAIRDNETGLLLPNGGSKAEFVAGKPPRLFAKRGHASNALGAWRCGHWINDIDQYGDGDGLVPWNSKFNNERAAKRTAMNIEVVEVELKTKED